MFRIYTEQAKTSRRAAKICLHKVMKHNQISRLNGYTRVVIKQVQNQWKSVCDQSKKRDIGDNAHPQPDQHNMREKVLLSSSLLRRRWHETMLFKFQY